MICTNCHEDDGVDQDLTSLPVSTVVKLCSVWLCDECMDEREAREQSQENGGERA